MNIRLIYLLIPLLLMINSCEESVENTDLSQELIGVYEGTVTLKIGSPEAIDVEGQSFRIEKIDDTHVKLIPISYPESSPLDSLELSASLTSTPLGFITTEGAMLSISSENFGSGTVSGTPFSLNSVQPDAHGKYDRDKEELLFAIEIDTNGTSDFEFFVGTKQ